MFKLKDATVLIIKESPNKKISLSSLMLSIGIKQHKMIHLHALNDAVGRTFHDRFDIVVCDHSYRQQVKASDVLHELHSMGTIDERSTIIIDCLEQQNKDSSYYLADVHLGAEDSLKELSEQIRLVVDKKNRIWPLLEGEQLFTTQEMAKRYEFFEQHYPEYKYDLILHRAHHYLVARELKQATEMYGVLIKETNKKDYSIEVSFFLNALILNNQWADALELHNKFDASSIEFGQPFDDIGAYLMLKNGDLLAAYQRLSASTAQYGFSLTHRTALGLMSVVMGKNAQALEHFSSNLMAAKVLNRNVSSHILNYLFALLMLWMKNGSGNGLYEKKFTQMMKEVSRYKLTQAEKQQLELIRLHRDYLHCGSQTGEATIRHFVKSISGMSAVAKIHGLYLAAVIANKALLSELVKEVNVCDSVFMLDALPPICAALTKFMELSDFANEISQLQFERVP